MTIGSDEIPGKKQFWGRIDEVRIYNRALTQAEIQTDMNTSISTPDTTPPTDPTNLTATPCSTQINLSWTASTDNIAVTGYQIERCQGTGCRTFALLTTVTGTTLQQHGPHRLHPIQLPGPGNRWAELQRILQYGKCNDTGSL